MGAHRCDEYIKNQLENKYNNEKIFDGYWRDLHKAFEDRITDRLTIELSKRQREVFVSAETPEEIGRFDILLITNGYGPITLHDCPTNKSIAIELKTGYSWSIEQLERYLWKVGSLILARLVTADAVVFNRTKLMSFLIDSLEDRIARAKRLLEGDVKTVPNSDCYECRIQDCQFNRSRTGNKNNMVLVKSEQFHRTPEVMNNIYPTVDKTIELVLMELDNVTQTE